jgi:hypothetical protein
MLVMRIRGHAFQVRPRYEAGQELTLDGGEAQAFNQLMLENIRNNVAEWVQQALGQERVLGAQVHSELQARISDYASGYQFTLRPESHSRKGPLEIEIDLVAQEWAAHQGGEPEVQMEEIARLRGLAEVHEEAKRRIDLRAKTARAALAELMD